MMPLKYSSSACATLEPVDTPVPFFITRPLRSVQTVPALSVRDAAGGAVAPESETVLALDTSAGSPPDASVESNPPPHAVSAAPPAPAISIDRNLRREKGAASSERVKTCLLFSFVFFTIGK
jgi:hypothetical protein